MKKIIITEEQLERLVENLLSTPTINEGKNGKWIPKDLKKGALKKKLGVDKDEKIPVEKLNKTISKLKKKAEGDKKLSASDSKTLKQATLAKTLKSFKK